MINPSSPRKPLWIALKSWYLWYSEQQFKKLVICTRVVNCSQKLISLIFGTTPSRKFSGFGWLWIALKSWYLWYSEQLLMSFKLFAFSCELLSKVDIFDIRNNSTTHSKTNLWVVNCSQKLISLIFGTTFIVLIYDTTKLWIALKSWYLWYSEQLLLRDKTTAAGCELLSKVDIFDIRNNVYALRKSDATVVNCSQKLISLIFGTTSTG